MNQDTYYGGDIGVSAEAWEEDEAITSRALAAAGASFDADPETFQPWMTASRPDLNRGVNRSLTWRSQRLMRRRP